MADAALPQRSANAAGTAAAARGPWLFWLAFHGAVLAAWVVLFLMVRASAVAIPVPDTPRSEFWASLCVAAGRAHPVALVAMWAVMVAAMMLPTVVPAVRTFGDLAAIRATDGAGMTMLVAGYVAVWMGFAALAAGLQFLLSAVGLLAPDGSALLPWLDVVLLAAAGAYQLSPAKAACLSRCRHPLMFFMEHWRPGPLAAWHMGLRLGALCLGCCWALMLLAFVGGVMNLLWMGAATLFMVLEKLPGPGRRLTRPAGVALLAAAAFLAAGTLRLF